MRPTVRPTSGQEDQVTSTAPKELALDPVALDTLNAGDDDSSSRNFATIMGALQGAGISLALMEIVRRTRRRT